MEHKDGEEVLYPPLTDLAGDFSQNPYNSPPNSLENWQDVSQLESAINRYFIR